MKIKEKIKKELFKYRLEKELKAICACTNDPLTRMIFEQKFFQEHIKELKKIRICLVPR